jgi:hypothetical protein
MTLLSAADPANLVQKGWLLMTRHASLAGFLSIAIGIIPHLGVAHEIVESVTILDPPSDHQADNLAKPKLPAARPMAQPRPFRVEVVDRETGRGVPLVELRTVNQIRYVTDSNGIVAFDEPGLFGRKVFFSISSHGYDFAKDGFGYRGKALDVTYGGRARIEITRRNIAQRLYRVTGEGIYRDSVMTGDPTPIREPLLNGRVFGQDSVVNAEFGGKIHWFWGDTNRPDYPLGNYHVPGATSDLPARGGLDPDLGVNLTYLLDDNGFARPTAAMPGEGPTWISGLVVLKDGDRRQRMFAVYAKIRNSLEVYERGLVEFNATTQKFEKVLAFPPAAKVKGELPDGHTFIHRDGGIDYVYYASPFPLVRLPANPDDLKRVESVESFTCLKPGSTAARPEFDRDANGILNYEWRRNAPLLRQEPQNKLVATHRIRPEEALIHLKDIETGRTVIAHAASVYWNDYRRRWVLITAESHGSSSLLGEIWFAEADTPVGPWVFARKVVTHEKYSFYNPKQHPMFDKDGGRTIFFEGTYTTTFSGNPDPTPRYDYNQVMYKLNLEDHRLVLPVAIYRASSTAANRHALLPLAALPTQVGSGSRRVAFFAPDRDGLATLPVFSHIDPAGIQTLSVPVASAGTVEASAAASAGKPIFYVMPANYNDHAKAMVSLYEIEEEPGGLKTYTVVAPDQESQIKGKRRMLGRVWRNPARFRLW